MESMKLALRLICFLMFPTAVVATALVPAKVFAAEPSKPNVLIIYADDLGWGETGVQGCQDIPTPNIDSIAKNGLRCTQGYVAATYCSPSRAGLMTGKYPTRFGHEFNAITRKSGLSLAETTLADRLKKLGYATAAVGKWHLGDGVEYHPTKRGFDEFYGTLANTPFYRPTNFIDSQISPDVHAIDDPEFYTTDKYAERSVDWLERNRDKPWFLYLPFNAQHAPLQAPKKYLDRFPSITDEKRKIFAAMMSSMDDAVGAVLGKIRALGQEKNTLVFFIGDNGGPTQSTTSKNGALRGFKMTTFEGGPRVPFFVQWKGTLPAGQDYNLPVMNLDVLPTCLAAAGSPVDSSVGLDGLDLVPFLTGKNTASPHETMFWRFGEQWAVRHGDWKLVVSKGGSGKAELYNLSKDISESDDLATSEPTRAADLKKRYDAWSAQQAEPTVKDLPPKNAPRKRAQKQPAVSGPPKRVLVADSSTHRLAIVGADGKPEWEITVGDIHDAHLLPNGNLLFQQGWTKVQEMTPDKKIIWEYDASKANEGKRVEVHAFQRLSNGLTMIAESGSSRIIEVDQTGKIVQEMKLKVEQVSTHSDTRLVRKLTNGNYLVAQEHDGVVREYEPSGKVVWEFSVPLFDKPRKGGHGPEAFGNAVFSATRLDNGNTLIGTGNGHSVLEVTPAKEIVWKIEQNDLPGITLAWVTRVERLANGNTIVGNCHAGPTHPQIIEVSPDKKVLWTWKDFKLFGDSTTVVKVLDPKS